MIDQDKKVKCRICNRCKPITEFSKRIRIDGGDVYICFICYNRLKNVPIGKWNIYKHNIHNKEDDVNEYVDFGDVSRGKLGIQCQYGSRYVDGEIEGWPNLGEGLRFKGNINNYHSLKIHRDDVDEFVRRYKLYLSDKLNGK